MEILLLGSKNMCCIHPLFSQYANFLKENNIFCFLGAVPSWFYFSRYLKSTLKKNWTRNEINGDYTYIIPFLLTFIVNRNSPDFQQEWIFSETHPYGSSEMLKWTAFLILNTHKNQIMLLKKEYSHIFSHLAQSKNS